MHLCVCVCVSISSDVVGWRSIVIQGLTGTIPQQLGQLTHLVNVSLHDTEVTGELPSSFGDLINLGTFTRGSLDPIL